MSKQTGSPGASNDPTSYPGPINQEIASGDRLSQKLFDRDDEIDLNEIWRAIKRRKKIFGVTTGAVFIFSLAFTTFQRIFNPLYEGSFLLLITQLYF